MKNKHLNNFFNRRFYVDAIPMVGTGAAVRQITQLIQNNKITGVFAEMWLSSLAFIQHPTKEMISEISVSMIYIP